MALITIENTNEALKEIRLHNNLKMFRDAEGDNFCEKYNITPQQFNYLVSVVAVERINQAKLKKK